MEADKIRRARAFALIDSEAAAAGHRHPGRLLCVAMLCCYRAGQSLHSHFWLAFAFAFAFARPAGSVALCIGGQHKEADCQCSAVQSRAHIASQAARIARQAGSAHSQPASLGGGRACVLSFFLLHNLAHARAYCWEPRNE